MSSWRRVAVGCVGCLPLLAGCLERTVTVTSEPPGAVVWLNNTEVGRTPVTTGFLFYGDYDVQVRKEGYESLITHQSLSAPIYEQPPLDLVATALPTRIRTNRTYNFELQPLPAESRENRDGLLGRAREMRLKVIPAPAAGAPAATGATEAGAKPPG